MLLICDHCGENKKAILKIPASAYYVENRKIMFPVEQVNSINVCLPCFTKQHFEGAE